MILSDKTTEYAEKVLNGEYIVGQYVKLACKRHIDDMEKSIKDPEYQYYFNVAAANEMIDLMESLTLAEGEAKTKFELEPFQQFIFGSLFGWLRKKDNYRRFRESYIQLARQNGKSILNGGIGIKISNFDGYKYAQCYCTATKQQQAKIVFNEMVKFIKADKDLAELFNIKEYCSTIEAKLTNSTIKALGRDTKSIDGFRPSFGCIDEYHAHKDNQMYKLLLGGTGKLNQCLISAITTAGFDLNCPCFELYNYCCKLLEGVHENETQFIYIAQLDKDDNIWDPENWIKANPLICKTQEGIETLKDLADKAREMGGAELRDFLTKRLNIWVQLTEDDFLNYEDVEKCLSDLDLENFRGKTCNVGIDLSSGGDLTSIGLIFDYMDGDKKQYFLHSHSFIPVNRLNEHIKTDKAPYDMWLKDGLLTATQTLEGIKTDYKYIIAYLRNIITEYELDIEQIGYDPHNADAFLDDLMDLGECVEIYQNCKSLNDATEDFRLEVKAGNIKINKKQKLLIWSICNAKTVSNSNGEIKIDKNKRVKRIDPVDSIIDAYKLAFKSGRLSSGSITNEYLNKMGW